ncbi:MAG: hypothetical protein IJ153_09945 [Clostridia bacterium]|nr:hypothetical protein [Clostridia bacterium]
MAESIWTQEDPSFAVWKMIIEHQGETFETSGRGRAPGVPFSYTVRQDVGKSGKHYQGQEVSGWANEMVIDRKKGKSITRASVDIALEQVRLFREEQGEEVPLVSGPKKLIAFGASYIYPIFASFGLIRTPKRERIQELSFLTDTE